VSGHCKELRAESPSGGGDDAYDSSDRHPAYDDKDGEESFRLVCCIPLLALLPMGIFYITFWWN